MHGEISRELDSGASRRCWKRLSRESGQSLIVVVISMTLLLAIAAFALDTALLFIAHHRAQVAADAGALSAAQDMETTATPQATIQSDGASVANQNDAGSTVTISEPNSISAKAEVTAPLNLPFGSLFGLGSATVSAHAVAQVDTAETTVAGGQVLGTACPGDNTNPCTYDSGSIIPTSGSSQTSGWQVTDAAEDPTTNGTNHGETTVNIQTCDGTTGRGSCYSPGSTTPVGSDDLTQVVDLNGQSEGGMWQTVPTTPNATYVLTFWLTGNPALDGWPNATANNFPLDVWITSGSGSAYQYTPSIKQEGTTPSNACQNAPHPSDYVACGWWDYQDEVCGASGVTLQDCTNGVEEADFTVESLTFVADSSATTITFNSEVYDDDEMDGSDGWFNCGPEVADITFGPPAIQLTQ